MLFSFNEMLKQAKKGVYSIYSQTRRSIESAKINVKSSPFILDWVIHPPEMVKVGKMF